MSEHRDEHIDLCAAQALGTLSDEDRRRLEAHLAEGCRECEAALADFSAATVMLAASAPAAEPSPGLRQRVLAAVEAERAASRGIADGSPAPPADGAAAPEAPAETPPPPASN